MNSRARIATAFEQISDWMLKNGAPLLVSNLADGATVAQLEKAERDFGFRLPVEMKALWSVHFGQKDDANGFFEIRELLNDTRALSEKETVDLFLEWLRENPDDWAEAGVTQEEVHSANWIPIAGIDSDLIVVSAVSGRVFSCENDSPPFHLLAASITEWIETFAAEVLADDFAVEEGFGDYFLARRNRALEKRDAERLQQQKERQKYRAETPFLEQLTNAISTARSDDCQEVLERAITRETGEHFSQGLAFLFASGDPLLIAAALQPLLNIVTLTTDQWVDVAVGAALLENNAIADFALARCGTVTTQRLQQITESASSRLDREKRLVADFLKRFQVKEAAAAPGGFLAKVKAWFH